MGFWLISFLFPSLSQCHRGQQSPIFCVQRRGRPDGNCMKATSYLANCASQNQLYCIKNVVSNNVCVHTQLAVCWRMGSSNKEPMCSGKRQLLPRPALTSKFSFLRRHCRNGSFFQGSYVSSVSYLIMLKSILVTRAQGFFSTLQPFFILASI